MNACLKAAGKMGEWRRGAEAEGRRDLDSANGPSTLNQEQNIYKSDWCALGTGFNTKKA